MSAFVRSALPFAGALVIVPVLAQPAASRQSSTSASTSANTPASTPASAAMGMPMRGGFRPDRSNTPGWPMMTSQERMAHRQKMHSLKTYDECKTYMTEHHKLMEARAKERGRVMPEPRFNACDRMKERGLIK